MSERKPYVNNEGAVILDTGGPVAAIQVGQEGRPYFAIEYDSVDLSDVREMLALWDVMDGRPSATELQEKADLLDALMAHGVGNWDGYADALADLEGDQ